MNRNLLQMLNFTGHVSSCFILQGFIVFLIFSPSMMFCQDNIFIKGADVSFLQQEESHNALYKDGGNVKDALTIFRDHGMNYCRLRIWHTPPGGLNGLASALEMAAQVKQWGMKLLLDFHYSDWWADPGHQTKPAAWDSLPFSVLVDSVNKYTTLVINALKNQRSLPDMVQIGNEITCGMLWPDGSVCGINDTPAQWHNLGLLLKAARDAVQSAASPDTIPVMVHSDRGGSMNDAIWFYDHLLQEEVPFDIIGLSYYPWWHGNMNGLNENLDTLSVRYMKGIIVVETAYPWTLGRNDTIGNIVGDSSQLLPEYPATPSGQQAYIRDLVLTVRNVYGGRGVGVFYWEPDWISAVDWGSAWENLALFDFNGNLLPAIDAFNVKSAVIEFSAGWNLLSLPIVPLDSIKAHLFPTAISDAFVYAGGVYTSSDTLRMGQGFWLKFAATDSVSIIGIAKDTISIDVIQGWNLIGGLNKDIPIIDVVTNPLAVIGSTFFKYKNGYISTDSLSLGSGCWIKANYNGKIILK
jgi:arabinogalactan endo-1,4-beta-galactosidase